jgi:hypothetical protein
VPEERLVDGEPEDTEDEAAWDAWNQPVGKGPRAPRLTSKGRTFLIALIAVLVAAVAVVVLVTRSHSGNGSSAAKSATARVVSAHAALDSSETNCAQSGSNAAVLACKRQAAETLSLAFRNFNVDLDRITMPGAASEARDTVEEDADLLSNAYDLLAVATSLSSYDHISVRETVPGLRASFDRHYAALLAVLGTG